MLVSAEWLKDHLHDSDIRIIDTSVDIVPQPPGASDYVSRYDQYRQQHIPGAAYLHMVNDLSDAHGSFPFALAQPKQIASKLSALGITADTKVILYGNEIHWATHRCWWVLAYAGANVHLLNGSFKSWCEAGYPTHTGDEVFLTTKFSSIEKSAWIASKDDVIASLDDPNTALVNALSSAQFQGRGQAFGRPGRIPGSISVPAQGLIDSTNGKFKPKEELAKAFESVGADKYASLITYCGGGIAASTCFFALRLLGYDNISLYDGSLLEWSEDPNLPLEVD